MVLLVETGQRLGADVSSCIILPHSPGSCYDFLSLYFGQAEEYVSGLESIGNLNLEASCFYYYNIIKCKQHGTQFERKARQNKLQAPFSHTAFGVYPCCLEREQI
ncbi:MAG: hypothetical protein BGN96_05600 [Bacteroidales bacterium 45-6]|nr:MAG: hypothetical protein BGN96_05600 [Bacteroidales bacterium 45-6]